ncbi:MAG: taurine dioxygenase [Deltaproteobacteria bacterium]|nr:taurine dioxygenase [Deltaproteobacteria bacterium]
MKLKPFGGALGAEIEGIDLRDVSDRDVENVRAALLEYEVLFFRETGLDDESQLALAARFGTPSVFPLARAMGKTEPDLQVIRDGPESPPATDYWHTDVTWTAQPPRAAFLRATVVPKQGGDTMWASTTAAYDALSAPMRAFLDGLSVRHDNTNFIAGMAEKIGEEAARSVAEKLRANYPPVVHPLVRTHPETGRRALLFGGHFMRAVEELTSYESDALLAFLWCYLDRPHFHARWQWAPGDLAIWDQYSTVHRGLSDHVSQEREVRRCLIDGERPLFSTAGATQASISGGARP